MRDIVAILPAHNEAGRVGRVVASVRASGAVRRVLVVDDGSTDATAEEARAAGAEVLALRPNRGKGGAMKAALEQTQVRGADAVLFVDTDLVGLRPDHVRKIVDPLQDPNVVMVVGYRDHRPWNAIQQALPPITGERAVRKRVLDAVHPEDWAGFRVEAGINEAARRVGGRVEGVLLDGVDIVTKWQKLANPAQGVADAARMMHQVFTAMGEARQRVTRPPPGPFVVECIVPAHNESGRVGNVVRTLRASGCFRRVLVVDDGSTDATAEEARAAGAEVLALRPNRGKGGAMYAAFRTARAPWVAFFDADLLGLTADHVRAVCAEARSGTYGMVTATFTMGGTRWEELYALHGFDLTGQRVLHRSVLERLPERYWRGYGIEVALDESCARLGYAFRRVLLRGMRITSQREKLGPSAGPRKTASIMTEALRAAARVRSEPW